MASTAQPQQPITIIDALSRVWKPLPIVLGILLILTLILASYFVRILAVKLAKRWMKSARAKALPRQLVLPTVHAQRVTPSKTPSRISLSIASSSRSFASSVWTSVKATGERMASIAFTVTAFPTRALASIRAPPSNARAGAAICKAASYFAIGKLTRSMYRVPPMPASYGDSEGMKTVWAESWPLLRAQDRRERKVAFLHLSRATFSSFVDSVLSPFTALRRMFGAEKTLPVSKKVMIVVDGPTTPPPSYCSQTSGSSVPSSWLNADELRSPVLSGSESTTGVAVPPPSHQSMRTKDGFVSVPLLPFLFFGFCEFPLGLYLARLSSVYRTRLSRLRKFIIFHYCVLFGSSSDGD